MKRKRTLLLAGMALVVPCYLFAALNVVFSPWDFLPRSRAALALLCALAAGGMLLIARAADRHEAFLTRHARAIRAAAVLAFFAAQMFFGSQMRFSPDADSATCYNSAIEWVQTGQIGEYRMAWMSIVPNIFPQFVLEVLILRAMRAMPFLAGVDLYYGIVLFNAALFAAGFWAMLKLAERLRGGAGQAVFAANMALCLPMFYCTSELYSDALSMPFLMLALCLLAQVLTARDERVAHAAALLAGFALLIGMEIRATVVIVAIAAAIVAALLCRPRRLLCFVTAGVVLLAGHTALIRYRDGILGAEQVAQNSLPVSHYLMMGTPDPLGYGNGSFNYADRIFTRSIEDPQERSAACWHEFHERLYALRYPNRMLSALSRKMLSVFGDGTYNLRQIFGTGSEAPPPLKAVLIDDTPQSDAYRHLCTGVMLAQLLFACAGVAGQIARREAEAADALCAVELVGIFLLLMLWESNARYFFHAVPVLLMVSALGQQRAADALRGRLSGRKRP